MKWRSQKFFNINRVRNPKACEIRTLEEICHVTSSQTLSIYPPRNPRKYSLHQGFEEIY